MKVDVGEDFYKLLHPALASLIVSVDEEGKPNVMTCSWIMPLSEEPPLVGTAISREAYSNELILKTGEFTVNIPSRELLDPLWLSGTRSGWRVDKVKLAGFTMRPAKKVRPPIIEQCIGHLECKVRNAVEVGESTLFVAEVLEAYADESLFSAGRWNVEKANLLLHVASKLFLTSSGAVIRAQ